MFLPFFYFWLLNCSYNILNPKFGSLNTLLVPFTDSYGHQIESPDAQDNARGTNIAPSDFKPANGSLDVTTPEGSTLSQVPVLCTDSSGFEIETTQWSNHLPRT